MSAQPGDQPTEEELRAYEAELSRITSSQLVIQAAASLLNVGGRRLGLGPGGEQERDLEQVRDAIDAVRALLPILERRMPAEQARPLRDALSQLQMAYARLAQAEPAPPAESQADTERGGAQAKQQAPPTASPQAPPDAAGSPPSESASDQPGEKGDDHGPGPAERSGRLWVPGR